MTTSDPVIPYEEGRIALDFLKTADLERVDFSVVKKRTDILVRCGFSGGELEPHTHSIFRGMVVKEDDIPLIKKVSRISYRPRRKTDGFSLNRASTNKYQVFYGGVPTPDFQDAKIGAVLEIDTIREDSFPEGVYEYIVMGMWFVKKPFFCVSAGMHSQIAADNQWAKNIVVKDHEFCQQMKHGDFIREIMQFMADEFGKEVPDGKDYLYKISAAYGDSLFDVGVSAIMFPSVQTNGKSFNLAIRREVVDNGCIDIEAAAIMKGSRIDKDIFWGWYLQCPRIYGDDLRWTEPPFYTQIWGNELDEFRKIIEQKGSFGASPIIIR